MKNNPVIKATSTIVYINYSPYENSGHILDFIKEKFQRVIVFYFNFYSLNKKNESSSLRIFKRGRLIRQQRLFQIPSPSNIYILFLLLPIRSFVNFTQILYYTHKIRLLYKSPFLYFTVNAFTAWVGIILRKIKLIDKTIFWVWDYYPMKNNNKIVMGMRWIYWQFDKMANKSDRIIFLNSRLIQLRKDAGVLPKHDHYRIIPIGTDPIKTVKQKNHLRPILGFIGVIKRSQGLETVYDAAPLLTKKYSNIELDVVGSGPDESYFKKRAKKGNLKTHFYGFISDEKVVMQVVQKFEIGLALYIPNESNVSYYGDPSKIKDYLSQGIPVITTDVFQFSREIHNLNAGIIIPHDSPQKLLLAIEKIIRNYYEYQVNALKLAKKYEYRALYPKLFSD